MAQAGQWIKRGQFVRISPCGKYQVQKARIAGVVAYYVYPVPIGPNLGGPYSTAAEAFQRVEEIVNSPADTDALRSAFACGIKTKPRKDCRPTGASTHRR